MIAAFLDDHLPDRLRQIGARIPRFDHEGVCRFSVVPGEV